MSEENQSESFAPVRRDRGLLGFPKRNARAALFVFFSVLVLVVPVGRACWKHDAWWLPAQGFRSPDENEARTIGGHLGRGKEVFVLVAESAIPIADGFPMFDAQVRRAAFETDRLRQDLRGLAFALGRPSTNEAPTRFTAALKAVSQRLLGRMTIVEDLRALRCILCDTASGDDPDLTKSTLCVSDVLPLATAPRDAHQESAKTQATNFGCDLRLLENDQAASVRSLLEKAKLSLASDDLVNAAAPDGTAKTSGDESPASVEPKSKHVSDRYREFVWKRGELLQLIHDTLHPAVKAPKPDPTSVEKETRRRLGNLTRHAVTLQRVAYDLSTNSVWVSVSLAVLVILFWYRMWVGRQYALGRGRWRAQIVVYIFFVLQVYNIVLISAYQPEVPNVDEESLTAKTQFIREEYKTATLEIHHRLEQEQHFYILKFTMIGTLLAVFFRFLLSTDDETSVDDTDEGRSEPKRTRRIQAGVTDAIDKLRSSKIAAFFFWAAVVINCIVDTRLRYNAVICNALGRWIRTLETSIEEHGLRGWETFFDQQAPISSSPLMQLAPTLLTTIVFVLTVVLFIAKEKENVTLRGNVNDNLKQVNLVFGGIAFLVMAFSSLTQLGMVWEWAGPVLLWVATGLVVLWLGPKSLQTRVFREDEITDPIIGYAFPFHYIDLHNTPAPRQREPIAGSTLAARIKRRLLQFARTLSNVLVWLRYRTLSFLPHVRIRHWLVTRVKQTLQVRFIYLELSADPPLSQILSVASDGSISPRTGVLIWSLLYLKAGEPGVTRITKGMQELLPANTASAASALRWITAHTSLIEWNHAADSFRVCQPPKLARKSDPWPSTNARYWRCDRVYYSRVCDYYDEHNPWMLVVCQLEKDNGETPMVMLYFKDVESHLNGPLASCFSYAPANSGLPFPI